MVDEVNRLKQEGFVEGELQDAKSTFITNNYLKEESTSAIASSLGNAEVLGSWKLADEMPDKVSKTTLKDLNNSLQYIKGIKWSYLGDKKLFDQALPVFVGK
jgi:predicted Zn-dependent peptidase